MPYLIIVTFIWGFSFSLIGVFLSDVNTSFSAFSRILLASLLFLPFLKWSQVSNKLKIKLMTIGAIQIGLMYLFYYSSFKYISVPDILLFTIFTPLYISLIYDWMTLKRIKLNSLLLILFAIFGAALIRYQIPRQNFIVGFLLIQLANLCFAWGQVYYKIQFEKQPFIQKQAIIWFYLGALIVTFIFFLYSNDLQKLPHSWQQWITILWLGLVASGLGYFLWNYGATKVSSGVLAMMNNAVIPVGILINVFLFHQHIHWIRFLSGSAIIILALILHYILTNKTKLKF